MWAFRERMVLGGEARTHLPQDLPDLSRFEHRSFHPFVFCFSRIRDQRDNILLMRSSFVFFAKEQKNNDDFDLYRMTKTKAKEMWKKLT